MRAAGKICVWLLLGASPLAYALECIRAPEQVAKDIQTSVQAAVGRIGAVSGAELKADVKTVTADLMGKLPAADQVYLEQMMFAAYCSSLKAARLSEDEKAARILEYRRVLRQSVQELKGESKGEGAVRNPEKVLGIENLSGVRIGMPRQELNKYLEGIGVIGEWSSAPTGSPILKHTGALFSWPGTYVYEFDGTSLKTVQFRIEVNSGREVVTYSDVTSSSWRPERENRWGNDGEVSRRCAEAERQYASKFIARFGQTVRPLSEVNEELRSGDFRFCESRSSAECQMSGSRNTRDLVFSDGRLTVAYRYSGLTAEGVRRPGSGVIVKQSMQRCVYRVTFS
jgi:hypothetical protein